MAAMPFPCNSILLIQGNLPGVILVLIMNYAICLIPYFNLLFSFIIIFVVYSNFVSHIVFDF